jgi:hypothetical protein
VPRLRNASAYGRAADQSSARAHLLVSTVTKPLWRAAAPRTREPAFRNCSAAVHIVCTRRLVAPRQHPFTLLTDCFECAAAGSSLWITAEPARWAAFENT